MCQIELNHDQLKVLDRIPSTDKEYIAIYGPAGVGKSVTIGEFIKREGLKGKKVLVLATTGIAGDAIGGETVFRGLGITVNDLKSGRLGKKATTAFEEADYIVIDEASMMTKELFLAVKHFKKENQKVIFLADLSQLLPVIPGKVSTITNSFDDQLFSIVDEEMEVMLLTKVMRQTDERFINILGRVSKEGFFPELNELFAKKYILESECTDGKLRIAKELIKAQREGKKVCYIAATNKKCDEINKLCQDFLAGNPNKTYESYYTEVDDFSDVPEAYVSEIKAKIAEEKKNGKSGEDMMPLILYEGQRVLFTANERIIKDGMKRKYVNGSMGTVEMLGDNAVWVKIDKSKEVVMVEYLDLSQYVYYDKVDGSRGEFCYAVKSYIPLRSGYANTAHKCQGMSLDEAYIDPEGCFLPGQFYTMLSRVRTIDGVHLVNEIKPDNVIVNPHSVALYMFILRHDRGYTMEEIVYLRGYFNSLEKYMDAEKIYKTCLEYGLEDQVDNLDKVTFDIDSSNGILTTISVKMGEEFNELYSLRDPRIPFVVAAALNKGEIAVLDEWLDGHYDSILDLEKYGLPLLERPCISITEDEAQFEVFVAKVRDGVYEDPDWDRYVDEYLESNEADEVDDEWDEPIYGKYDIEELYV